MENQSHLCSFSPSRKRPISGFSAQAQLQRSGGGSTTPEEHPGPPLRPAALCPRQLLLRAPRDVHPRPPTARAQAQARTQTRRETTRAHVPKPTRERGGGEDPDRRRRGEERAHHPRPNPDRRGDLPSLPARLSHPPFPSLSLPPSSPSRVASHAAAPPRLRGSAPPRRADVGEASLAREGFGWQSAVEEEEERRRSLIWGT
jgi:hypothetical protein